jgi:glycosyltransferase involved in cell wall biosynthesis
MLPLANLEVDTARALRRVVRTSRPDVIQAHGGEALKYAVASGAGAAGIVYRRIGLSPRSIDHGLRRIAYAALMRRTARIVAVAEVVRRETIRTFRLSAGQVVTIPNAVASGRLPRDASRQTARRRLGIPEAESVVLSLGALSWEKDPLTHLAVAERVLKDNHHVIHLIAGDGPMRARVVSEIERRGLVGRVRAIGSREDVPDLLAAADLLLFASRPDGMEGMPAVVIEAGMAGIPVVGYEVAGVPEVVIDGETGLLVPHGEVSRLAEAALRLLSDPGLRATMGSAAAERCWSRYQISSVAPRYLDVYRQASEMR